MADRITDRVIAESREEAGVFADAEVVAAYRHRHPYSQELFDTLLGLIGDEPGAVLDAGCGPGSIALGLAAQVSRVDAVDPSAAMIRAGKARVGGDHPALRWICASMEEAMLSPPYSLVVAGSSLHWMDWRVVLPRFAKVLTGNGLLALVTGGMLTGEPWLEKEWALFAEYNPRIGQRIPKPWSQVLADSGLFIETGALATQRRTHRQSVEDYVAGCHSRGIYTSRIGPEKVAEFDQRMRCILNHYSTDGILEFGVTEAIRWGHPGAMPVGGDCDGQGM